MGDKEKEDYMMRTELEANHFVNDLYTKDRETFREIYNSGKDFSVIIRCLKMNAIAEIERHGEETEIYLTRVTQHVHEMVSEIVGDEDTADGELAKEIIKTIDMEEHERYSVFSGVFVDECFADRTMSFYEFMVLLGEIDTDLWNISESETERVRERVKEIKQEIKENKR